MSGEEAQGSVMQADQRRKQMRKRRWRTKSRKVVLCDSR